MPDDEPQACTSGKVFVGWTATPDYSSATTAPTFVQAGSAVSGPTTYYAVFATPTGAGSSLSTTTYTFTSNAWADATNSWTSIKDGYALQSGQGVQVTAAFTGAAAETNDVFNTINKVVVKYCTNASKGAGSVKVSVGDNSLSKDVTKTGGTTLRELEYDFNSETGKVGIEVTCSANSIYIYSVAITAGGGITYADYSVWCNAGTDVENVNVERPAAVKVIRDGQLLLIRGEEIYSITGARIQ